jgi:DNA-binding NtrC family response regulator
VNQENVTMGFDPRDTQALIADERRVVVGLRRMASGEVLRLDASTTGGGKRWSMGSNVACDLVVDDPFVSGRHCMLDRKASGAITVRDLPSRNGTFIDGNRIEIGELRVGSFLAIGRTTFVAIAALDGDSRRAVELIRGNDPALRTTIDQAQRAAATECNVLILGETGTGKDLLARAIHEGSRRASGAFVAVNCGALPRELVASHLFGHEKGAFTGAGESRDGYFVEAHGGTLFLDEIGELPLELQPHLLRALETRRVRRIGGHNDRPVDVRIVAATNQIAGLGTDTAKLRADLYHRLATVVLDLPPLRDRMCDLGELVEGFLAEYSAEHGAKEITADAWDALTAYDWPGNVRELRASINRAVVFGGERLGPDDFFSTTGHTRMRHLTPPFSTEDLAMAPYHAVLRTSMEQALNKHGTIRAAATAIGMPKSTFADKAKAWKLVPRRRVRVRNPTKK